MEKLAILGGRPVRTTPFPSRVTMGEAEKRAVMEVMDSDCLSDFLAAPGELFLGGERVKGMERAWEAAFGHRHAVTVNSATSALMAAVGAVGIGPGDEVICSPYTMSASAACALFYGGIPVFADVDGDTGCLDPASIASRITANTRAVIVVHLFGRPAAMDEILSITRPRGIKVIEDCAQAPGATYRGRPVGTLGDVGCFSLNYHKHIHTGEGGVVVTQDDGLADRVRLIRNHGEGAVQAFELEDYTNVFGANFRLTELQAAIGIEQIRRLSGFLEVRRAHAARMAALLEGVDFLHLPAPCEDFEESHYVYPIRYDPAVTGVPRDRFAKAVNAEIAPADNVEAVGLHQGYVKPIYLMPFFQAQRRPGTRVYPFNFRQGTAVDYEPGLCPVAERLHEFEMLTSPLVREPLGDDDLSDFGAAIVKVASQIDALRP